VYPNLKEIIRETRSILEPLGIAQENKADRIWNFHDGRTIEFGSVQHENDKTNWQGRAHDLKCFDEITEFTKSQYQFIIGWNRTTDQGQRTRVVVTGNPPTDDAGNWIIQEWGPWLDEDHPDPAKPGELRWYHYDDDGYPIWFHTGEERQIGAQMIKPRSRTFIPAYLEDNPYLNDDGRYRAVLSALPEPLRTMFLKGKFNVKMKVDPFQVIPTDWVRDAQRRWLETELPEGLPISGSGLDPARGGNDNTALCNRYHNYFGEIIHWPGQICVDGPTVADLVRQSYGAAVPGYINLDVIGIGSSVYDSLKVMYNKVNPVNASGPSNYTDRSGKLKMRNTRAEYYWRMRDALDPEFGDEVCLPPGNEIIADLCSAHYKPGNIITIEAKDDIKKRIGRSPDKGESILLANLQVNPGVYFR